MLLYVILLEVFLEASKSCNAIICAPALFPRMSKVLFLKIAISWSKAIQTLVLTHLGNKAFLPLCSRVFLLRHLPLICDGTGMLVKDFQDTPKTD